MPSNQPASWANRQRRAHGPIIFALPLSRQTRTHMQPFITFASQNLSCKKTKVGESLKFWSNQSLLIKALQRRNVFAPFLGAFSRIPFRGFTDEPANQLFVDASEKVTLLRHYEEKYEICLRYSHFPCFVTIRRGKLLLVPIELCYVR